MSTRQRLRKKHGRKVLFFSIRSHLTARAKPTESNLCGFRTENRKKTILTRLRVSVVNQNIEGAEAVGIIHQGIILDSF